MVYSQPRKLNFNDLLSLQLCELNGQVIFGKPLYVALAQQKEDRIAQLQVLGLLSLSLNF